MAYLVDGNNVMAQRVGWHRDKAGARRRLLEELAIFTRTANEPVEVVFDGPPDELIPDGSIFKGVRVYYALPGSDADTRIKQMVAQARDRQRLKVVTSDKKLADSVRRYGVQVIRSGEFRRRIEALSKAVVDRGQAVHEPLRRTPGQLESLWRRRPRSLQALLRRGPRGLRGLFRRRAPR